MPEFAGEPTEDAALIKRSWRDPEAFAALYDRHAALLHRYVTRRLGDGAADDIVADTFLGAFRRRHRYDLSVSDARPMNVVGGRWLPSVVNGPPATFPRTSKGRRDKIIVAKCSACPLCVGRLLPGT
jgi:hypothetical protein